MISLRCQLRQQVVALTSPADRRELLRPGHQTVGFAESMDRDSVAADIGLARHARRAVGCAQKSAVAVAAGAREDDLALGGGEDGLEIPAIGRADRKRIELGGRNDMVGDQPVFGDPARPTRRVEADEPNEATRRRSQRAGRHPGDGDAGLKAVILLQGFEGGVERCGGTGQTEALCARSPARDR